MATIAELDVKLKELESTVDELIRKFPVVQATVYTAQPIQNLDTITVISGTAKIPISNPLLSNKTEGITIDQFKALPLQLDKTITNPGETNYNTGLQCMEVKGADTTLQVGQEMHVPVTNKSGVTINEGDVVYSNGYDSTSNRLTVTPSKANLLANARVLGMVTTTMINNAEGKVTVFGRVNGLNTLMFTEGAEVYLSEITSGGLTVTRPKAIPIQIGWVGKVHATLGFIEVNIRELDVQMGITLSHTATQTFIANTSQSIKFNTDENKDGIEHDVLTNTEKIIFRNNGTYIIIVEPQYSRTNGGNAKTMDVYLMISTDGGSIFSNIPDSNIKVSVSGIDQEAVTTLTSRLSLNADDVLKVMVQVEDAGLELRATSGSGTTPNDVPLTPSVICTVFRT